MTNDRMTNDESMTNAKCPTGEEGVPRSPSSIRHSSFVIPSFLIALALLAQAWTLAGEGPPAPIEVKVRVRLAARADLRPGDIRFALFPSGKRCCFTYNGCRNPRTIEVLSKLGFRTTVYCDPSTPADQLRALEAAGADIGIEVWGGQGNYHSNLGGNTVQEAFDACATSRIVLRTVCRGPLGATRIEGHYGAQNYLVSRHPDNSSGFGYAYHDCNYLIFSDNKPYPILLGRLGERLMVLRENFDNTMQSTSVPNEIIYYQIIANQFAGTLRRAERGQIVRFTLRDFKAPDLDDLTEAIGKYGQHELIWHASETMIGANEYVRNKARVLAYSQETAGGDDLVVTLGIDRDIFPPYLLTPLPLLFPKGTQAKSATAAGGVNCPITASEDGTCVDVPLRAILTGGCRMSVEGSAPDMTIPDEMPITLTVQNPADKPLAISKLEWVGNIGFTVGRANLHAETVQVGGGDASFELPPKGERKIQAVARTARGARFGLTPFQAILTASDGRVFAEGFELVVAPRLRVEMDPMQSVPLRKGRSQHFFVHVANGKSGRPGGAPDKFISHKAGACKGTIGWELPQGMKAVPPEQPFDLAENDAKTLIFRMDNEEYSGQKDEMVKPLIRLFAKNGEKEPLAVIFPGTIVIRDEERVGPKQLDEKGLLFLATWDDNTQNGRADKACGNPSPYFYPGHQAAYSNEGVKGWCMNTQGVCEIFDSYRNIDYYEGTVCLFVRKDPLVRNESTYVPDPAATAKIPCGRNNSGETLFTAGLVQNVGSSNSGISLRRFRSWHGKDGYLQLTYQMMGGHLVACQAGPFNWTEEWRHVAFLWSVKDKRLELYIDGKLAVKADPGDKEWHPSPWDRGIRNGNGWNMNVITSDHGAWTATCRDEVYIYNRALTPEEIQENRERAKRRMTE